MMSSLLKIRRPQQMWLVMVIVCFALCGVLSVRPGMLFVDFISFSERAQRLTLGDDLLHPLYPVGYPLILSGLHALCGDILVAGKLISLAAALGLAYGVSNRFGAYSGLLLLAVSSFLVWGTTPGTDMLAAAFSLLAILSVEKRPVWAGVMAGGAFLCRYSAVIVFPFVLWRSAEKRKTALTMLIVMLPHWGLALLLGESPFFDQSENLNRGGDYVGTLMQIASDVFSEPVTIMGLFGILAAFRHDPLARDLGAVALTTALLFGFVFSTPRLVLPIQLALVLGLGFWIKRHRIILPIAMTIGFWFSPSFFPNDAVLSLNDFSEKANLRRPFYTSSPWVYGRESGFLIGGLPLSVVGTPHQITPEELTIHMRQNGVQQLVLHRSLHPYVGLESLINGKSESLKPTLTHGEWLLFQTELRSE